MGSLLLAGSAWGATTQIYVTANNGVSGLTSTAYDPSGNKSSTWAGNWNAKITGGAVPAGSPALNTTWQSFCMDIGNSMASGKTYTYTASTFAAGNPPANDPPNPRWVFGGGSKAGYLYGKYLSSVVNSISRSALAIAIWEVLYESGPTYSVSTRDATKGFQVVGSGKAVTKFDANGFALNGSDANKAIVMANVWLKAAQTEGFPGAPGTTWWKETTEPGDPQSLIGVPSMVPEPSTYVAGLLLGLPVLVNGVRSWRKRRA